MRKIKENRERCRFDVIGKRSKCKTRKEQVMTLRIPCVSALAAAMIMAAAPAGAQGNVEAGGLTCRSPGGVGFVVGAVLNFDCLFRPASGGPPQHYVATVRRIGVDLGFTQNVEMGWGVFAPTAVVRPGDLAGDYGGVQAGATFGIGLGANVMIGGSNNSFMLQPLSGQAQAGINVAAGLSGLQLRAAPPYYGPAPRRIALRHHRMHHHARG
jgi:hypothetical protein